MRPGARAIAGCLTARVQSGRLQEPIRLAGARLTNAQDPQSLRACHSANGQFLRGKFAWRHPDAFGSASRRRANHPSLFWGLGRSVLATGDFAHQSLIAARLRALRAPVSCKHLVWLRSPKESCALRLARKHPSIGQAARPIEIAPRCRPEHVCSRSVHIPPPSRGRQFFWRNARRVEVSSCPDRLSAMDRSLSPRDSIDSL